MPLKAISSTRLARVTPPRTFSVVWITLEISGAGNLLIVADAADPSARLGHDKFRSILDNCCEDFSARKHYVSALDDFREVPAIREVVTSQYIREIGAGGYSGNDIGAVSLVRNLLEGEGA